jgi:hypothetical protein
MSDEERKDNPSVCAVKCGSDPDSDELEETDEPTPQKSGKKQDTETKCKCGYCELLSDDERSSDPECQGVTCN